jgi:hypothetical protein
VQSARTAQEQAARDWTLSFSSGLDLSHQEGREQFISSLHSTGFAGSFSQSDQVVQRMVQSAMESSGAIRDWRQEDRDALQAAIGAGIQRGGGARGRAEIDSALSNIRTISDAQRKEIGDRIEKMVGANSDEMAQLSSKVQQDASEGTSSRFFSAMRVEDATRWAEAQRDSQSATESFERVAALGQSTVLRQDVKIQAIGHQAVADGWDDTLLRLVAVHRLDMSSVEDDAGFWSRSGAMDHDTARASAAALALAEGPREARLDLAQALASHGFGSPALHLDEPTQNASLETTPPIRGATSAIVDEKVPRASTTPESVRSNVEANLGAANDLDARGQAAVQSFFAAKKEGNARKVTSALNDLERVINVQRAAHFESTFEETRGFLKAVQDFDMVGQFGDFEVNAQGIQGAAEAFGDAYRRAAATGSGQASAIVAGLSASLRGYSTGFDEGVEARRERAFEEASALGLPESASRYYADQSLVWQERIDKAIPRVLGQDPTFEGLKSDAKEQLGQQGLDMLTRAATAEPVAKKSYLEGALSIYRSRNPSAEPR